MSIDKTSGEKNKKICIILSCIISTNQVVSTFTVGLLPKKVKPTGDSLAAGTPRRKGMGAKTLGKMNSVQHLFHGAMVFVGDNGENCELKQGSTWI